jgi:hypothetical protein
MDVASQLMCGGSFLFAGEQTDMPPWASIVADLPSAQGPNLLLGLRPVRAANPAEHEWRQRGASIDFQLASLADPFFNDDPDDVVEGVEVMLMARDGALFAPDYIAAAQQLAYSTYEALEALHAKDYAGDR